MRSLKWFLLKSSLKFLLPVGEIAGVLMESERRAPVYSC